MSELRLTLLVTGVVFITALIWWERRRPRQANADGAERFGSREPDAAAAARPPREPGLALPEMRARESLAARDASHPVSKISPCAATTTRVPPG